MVNINSNFKNLKYIHLHQVLIKLRPLEQYYDNSTLENKLETQSDVQKVCEGFCKALKRDLSLEEVTSLYSAAIMLLLVSDPEIQNRRLELLNDCLNYSDTLKPTMIDYITRELIENFKYASSLADSNTEYDYMLYFLWAMPHIITASETGKMISLGLLRSFIAELANQTPIVMHIYRNISEIWQMVKTINLDTILDEWSIHKIYVLIKSFSLSLSTAALNTKNSALKQAGYRGFELPHAEIENEISQWFKTLRNKLKDKHTADGTKSILMLVRFIDYNIISFLAEGSSEVASETGNEAPLKRISF
ncbi:PREDICTED: uncharacterized protein LOC108621519 [Drosophila arizonae]|uniref:Uncharacterized protein LOC108621519 n=1 Tax=Drosophila arizonae TaxID=7263 RepID=A0ABM1Q4J8_DROAR|nr:PREDICTED: uncharacterized protein LOC108621519 [Drosophila arizonae]